MSDRNHAPRASSDQVPDWWVERLAAGDLPPDAAARLRARLEQAGELERLEQLASSNRELLERYPASQVVTEIQRRAERLGPAGYDRRPRSSWAGLPVLALGGSAALAASVLWLGGASEVGHSSSVGTSIAEPRAELITAKGLAPYLVIYRQTPSGAERLEHGSPVRAGDTLQVAYVGAGLTHGVVASVDAAGTVTLHHPEQPGLAAPLSMAGETPLEHAFELDATPGFERFVFVSGEGPFPTALVEAALRSGNPALPAHLTLTDVVLRKEEP